MEVLATIALIGVVVPVAMRGVSLSLAAAGHARRLAEATELGRHKLEELSLLAESTNGSGDFSPDFPDYHWTSQTTTRDYSTIEMTVTVNWQERSQDRNVRLATLVADPNAAGTTTGALP